MKALPHAELLDLLSAVQVPKEKPTINDGARIVEATS
jgi:hypothetical protein